MTKKSELTGKIPLKAHNVSHANNKSRRRFNVNLQKKRFWLPDEKRYVTLHVSTRGMRIIDKKGIRKFLLSKLMLKIESSVKRRVASEKLYF